MTAVLPRGRPRRILEVLGPAGGVLLLQLVAFWVPPFDQAQVYVRGLTQGLLIALMATGMALVYRANRILNFAQADLGILPAAMAVNLVVLTGLNYLLTLALGLIAAFIVGGIVELAVIRRFFASPRLIVTVATIGVSQLLAFVALWAPGELWDRRPAIEPFARGSFPLRGVVEINGLPFGAEYLMAWILGPLCLAGVAVVLRRTDAGIAIRAAAERAPRALMLGIPVQRLHTLVWAIAALLSFVSLYLQAGLFGLPLGQALGLTALLGALTAVTLGGFSDLPTIVAASMALGVLQQAVGWTNSLRVFGVAEVRLGVDAVSAVFGAVIVIALLLRRRGDTRVRRDATSSWGTADEVRPIPRELASLVEIRAMRWAGSLTLLIVAVGFPLVFDSADHVSKGAAVVAFSIIGLSLVVLTGWAGQISLGQLAFAAVGGAVTAAMIIDAALDPGLAMGVAFVCGAATAVLVGLPALRLRGLYLAVITLAFALAAVQYFLNPAFFDWVPTGGMDERPDLFGVWGIDTPTRFYYLCLTILALVLAALSGIRRSRTGRVLVALRDNEAGVEAYGVSVVRTKLTAFALSGGLAAVAGSLLVLLQRGYSAGLFAPRENLVVFTAAVVGGLGSLTGGILGALFLKGGEWWLPGSWRLFVSAVGVLGVLWALPGGLGGALFALRDSVLRAVARRRGLVVPSLVADIEDAEARAERAFEATAEELDEQHPSRRASGVAGAEPGTRVAEPDEGPNCDADGDAVGLEDGAA